MDATVEPGGGFPCADQRLAEGARLGPRDNPLLYLGIAVTGWTAPVAASTCQEELVEGDIPSEGAVHPVIGIRPAAALAG